MYFNFFICHKPIHCIYICPVINEQLNVALLLNSVLTPTVTVVSVQPRKIFFSDGHRPGLLKSVDATQIVLQLQFLIRALSLLMMGITKLADLIRSDAPDAISYKDISDYTGKKLYNTHNFALMLIEYCYQSLTLTY